MNCAACGKENPEQAKFCNFCGGPINVSEQINSAPMPPAAVPVQAERPSATGMIIFSVINIACCGQFIFGVIALIFALMSTSENNFQEAKNKLKISKILNIIGVSLSALIIIIYIVIMVMVLIFGTTESGAGFWNDIY